MRNSVQKDPLKVLYSLHPFSCDDFSLITVPKTTHFTHLERRSYSILRCVNIVIVRPVKPTLLERS